MGFGSVIASCWILFANYVNNGELFSFNIWHVSCFKLISCLIVWLICNTFSSSHQIKFQPIGQGLHYSSKTSSYSWARWSTSLEELKMSIEKTGFPWYMPQFVRHWARAVWSSLAFPFTFSLLFNWLLQPFISFFL